jgi:serine phosphatase RsbU (regulator of sigma subunit)
VCLAVIDPAERTLRYVCAGHPPPLVVAADGSTRYLPAPGGGPLSLAGPPPRVGTATLAPDELLLMFSDGWSSAAARTSPSGWPNWPTVASSAVRLDVPSLRAADATDRVAELTVERMTRQGYQDDVTLLALRLTASRSPIFSPTCPPNRASWPRCVPAGGLAGRAGRG